MTPLTVMNFLIEAKYKGRAMKEEILYIVIEKYIRNLFRRKRSEVSRKPVNKTFSFWKPALCGDERQVIFGFVGGPIKPRNLEPIVKHRRACFTVWGSISARGLVYYQFLRK